MSDNIKQFLNTWCSQNRKTTPIYNVTTPIGRPNQRLRFKCEVTVEGFNYVGFGSSTNKKDSQTNAARDFTNYLVREKIISTESIPQFSRLELVGTSEEQPLQFESQSMPSRPDSQFMPRRDDNENSDVRSNYIMNIFDQKKLEEAEDVDFTADIHGGWSLENAKANLHMYFQKNKLQTDYKYSTAGPDHNKSFIAELTFFCPQLKRNIHSRESGSNKQSASKACALSAIRQLFHLKVLEAFQGTTIKSKSEQIAPYKVNVDPDVVAHIENVIESLGLTPTEKAAVLAQEDVNMVVNYSITDFEPQVHHRPQIISWAPALPNWNVWTSCNIDEGEEAFLSLEEISNRMKENFIRRRSSDPELQRMLQDREQLPASSYENAIIDTIFENQIVMIRGETGSGKTTQVPQFILDHFIKTNRGAECNIIVTQPRRISAVSLAERVAQERGENLGQSCGYSVRFDTVLPQPYGGIFYCTVGTLLRKVEGGLRGVSHIIVDEIHERDCNTDFLLILLRDMAAAYPTLRIILMSATIDVKLFKDFFPSLYCLELEGRSFPVNHYFLEDVIEMTDFNASDIVKKDKKGKVNIDQDSDDVETTNKGDDIDVNCNLICDDSYKRETKFTMTKLSEKEISFEVIESLLKYIENIHPDGAVLIFLPGWNIIQMLLKHLSRNAIYGSNRFVLLALHSQVPREEQRKAFRPCKPGVRKIILATNIAETSITINDVMFVIDSCRAKIKMFTSRNNLTSYNTVWASKTNLEQRRGRAGRVREGYAFHLCSRARYDRLETHQTPEILRTALHEIALMIKLLKLGDTKAFLAKAAEQPPIDAIIEAEHLLKEMKAFDKNDELTPLGRILARLPIEPRMGKMIIYGCLFGVADALSIIAACTSLGDPFVIPPEHKRLSRQQVELAGGRCSDHVAILNAFQKWEYVQRKGQMSEEMFCETKGLNLSILKMSKDASTQIKNILTGAGFPEECLSPQFFDVRTQSTPLDNVINLLVLGLYPNVCYHKDKRKVLTTEGKAALIHKSSVNCSNFIQSFPSPFFIFGEKMRTRVIACKQMSMINPLQLLMFGARKVTVREGMIVLDDWLNLDMDFDLASKILALRPALEGLLVKACINPEMVMNPQSDDILLMDIVTRLSDPNVCHFGSSGPMGGAEDSRKRKPWEQQGNRNFTPRASNYSTSNYSQRAPSYSPRGQGYPSRGQGFRQPLGFSSSSQRPPVDQQYNARPHFAAPVPPRPQNYNYEVPNKFRATDSSQYETPMLPGYGDDEDNQSVAPRPIKLSYSSSRGGSEDGMESPSPNVGWTQQRNNGNYGFSSSQVKPSFSPINVPRGNNYPNNNNQDNESQFDDYPGEEAHYDGGNEPRAMMAPGNSRPGMMYPRPQYSQYGMAANRNFRGRQAPSRGRW